MFMFNKKPKKQVCTLNVSKWQHQIVCLCRVNETLPGIHTANRSLWSPRAFLGVFDERPKNYHKHKISVQNQKAQYGKLKGPIQTMNLYIRFAFCMSQLQALYMFILKLNIPINFVYAPLKSNICIQYEEHMKNHIHGENLNSFHSSLRLISARNPIAIFFVIPHLGVVHKNR